MNDIAEKYNIPAEIMEFVEAGLLQMAEENDEKATIEFDIPSLGYAELDGRYKFYRLIWINPEQNAEFCHFYTETPGDLPHFYVGIETDHSRDEQVEGLESLDNLIDWLKEKQKAKNG